MRNDSPQLCRLFLILDENDRMLNEALSNGSCGWMPLDGTDGDMEVEQCAGVPEAVPTKVRLLWGPEEARELLEELDMERVMEMYKADPTAWEEQVVALG